MATPVSDLLVGKDAKEKANIKASEIVKVLKKGKFKMTYASSYEIEIVDFNTIDGGIEIFARAWKNGVQLGFGADGTIDIERFRIFNPPILVSDPLGDVSLDQYNAKGEFLKTDTYREDPLEALKQSLTHTISLVGKEETPIVAETRGNTTSTFYTEAGDGRTGYINQASWATARSADGSTANATDYTSNNIQISAEDESAGANDFAIIRGFFPFITSAIPDTDTISSATFSVWVSTVGAGERIYGLIQTTQASITQLVGTDYDNLTLNSPTEGASRLTLTSTAAYTDATLNASGISWISKTGNTLLGLRHQDDIDNTQPAPGRQYMHVHSSEATGTTNDPKLVVVHSAGATTPRQRHTLLTLGVG